MGLQPATYEAALQKAQERPRKPRTPLSPRSTLKAGPAASNRRQSLSRKAVKKSRKKKRITTGQLKKKVWTEFSIFIRTRRANADGMTKCCTCPSVKHWKEMQAGHFLRGRLNANLFDERGTNEQCYACNVGRDGNVVEYYEWMLEHHGKEVIDELRRKNVVTHKWGPDELADLLAKYKGLNKANPLLQGDSD